MSRYATRRDRGGGLAYNAREGRWIARVQVKGVRHTRSHLGPCTPHGRRAAERMLRNLVWEARGGGARRWPAHALVMASGRSIRDVAVAAGLTERTGYRWAAAGEGLLTDRQAEDACDRLDLHPATVFGLDWWDRQFGA